MWCWHRIRESESGLCPACRTPYGDDPHEFSAVDMEEVVKANKEKAAAEKRERERLRQQQAASSSTTSGGLSFGSGGGGASSGALSNLGNMHIGGGSDGDLAVAMGSGSIGRGHLEPPKDRNQLANMRVIRRNLVYAVGLPPSVATEEQLRRPEYFGQYGKISKIVINRNHNGNGDPRRASASSYVTFAQKEDTLACILALDGFYVDGRNVRASYGTSKYCSAFIKNVRCNNPDCTYLHCMGDSEDTFTKQEIQAGYVTSGRDVLARQQQQLAGGGSRKRVGGGGPSGTGKVPSNPVFPAPTYDETPKPPGSLVVNISSGTSATATGGRSMSVAATGFSSVAAGVPSAAAVAAGKISRSISLGATQPTAGISGVSPATAVVTGLPPASTGKAGLKASKSFGMPSQTAVSGPAPATAASVVAGLASASSSSNAAQPPAHTTLTPLGSLKRGSSMPISAKVSSVSTLSGNKPTVVSLSSAANSSLGNDAGSDARGVASAESLTHLEHRKEGTALSSRQQREMTKLASLKSGGGPTSGGRSELQSGTSSSSSTPSLSSVGGPPVPAMKHAVPGKETVSSSGVIGGTVIGSINSSGGKAGAGVVGSAVGKGISGLGAVGSDSSAQSGIIIGGSNAPSLNFGSIGTAPSNGGSSLLGGQPFGGGVRSIGGTVKESQCTNIGGSVLAPQPLAGRNLTGGVDDNWGKVSESQDNGLFGGNSSFGIGGTGIWGNEGSGGQAGAPPIGNPGSAGSVIQPGNPIGRNMHGSEIGSGRAVTQTSSAAVGGAVGGSSLFGNSSYAASGGRNAGSSALANMLGIQLPSGSGSLREDSSLWGSSSNQPPVGSLGNPGVPPNPIGSGVKPSGGLVIGQRPGPGSSASVPIGGFGANNNGAANNVGNNNNDIALLQSLLPGVRITSGNAHQPAAPMSSGTNSVIGGTRLGSVSGLPPGPPQHQQQRGAATVGIGGINIHQQQHQGGRDTWGGSGLYASSSGAPNPVSSQQQQQQQQHRPAGIW